MDNLNIFIEGDDDGFNSQNAKFKFKQTVKQQLQNNNAFFSSDYSKLFNKYIKDDYELKFKSFKDGNVTVSLNKKTSCETNPIWVRKAARGHSSIGVPSKKMVRSGA